MGIKMLITPETGKIRVLGSKKMGKRKCNPLLLCRKVKG